MNNYDEWNKEKQIINKSEFETFYVNSREIWFTKMGENIGFEENGKKDFLRPVLIIKKIGNLFLTVALTSKGKDKNVFYHKFNEIELSDKNIKYKNSSYAILSQVKVMDKKRFTQNIGNISKEEFNIIKKKLKTLLF